MNERKDGRTDGEAEERDRTHINHLSRDDASLDISKLFLTVLERAIT